MNQNRTILRQWLGAVLGAVIIAAAVPATAWGQTDTNQGVRAGSNTTMVNGTSVTAGQVVSAGRGTTVTVTTTDRTGESTPKVAKVTVTKKEDFLASSATITGDNTVNKNGTVTLTATVTPTYANTVVWTVTAGTGSAEFVTGETTTAATVTSVVNHETGQATATLKGLGAGTVTVDVKATGDAAATLNETAKTVTVLNVPATLTTAPTATSAASQASYVLYGSSTALVSTGAASGGTMMYAVTTDNTQPAKSAFTSTVPTASGRAAGKYYVWYYVQGDDSHIDTDISSTSILVPVVKADTYQYPTNGTIIHERGTFNSAQNHFQIGAYINGHTIWLGYDYDQEKTLSITSKNSEKIWKIRLDVDDHNAYITGTPSSSPNSSYYYNSTMGNRYIIFTRNSTDFIGTSFTMTVNVNADNGFVGITKITIYYY